MRAACWAIVVVAACTPETDPAPAPPRVTEDSATKIRVTRDSEEGPTPCHPARVGEVVSNFLDTFNEGDPAAADYFSEEMEWYSMTEWSRATGKRHFVTSDRAGLRRYIERRSDHGERMVLLEVRVQFDLGRDLGHIAYVLERTADDVEPTRPIAMGKGAIECDTGRILLLSMGHDTRFQKGPEVCPGSADPPDIAVACGAA